MKLSDIPRPLPELPRNLPGHARRVTVWQYASRPVLDIAADGLMIAEGVGHFEFVAHDGCRLDRFDDGRGLVLLPHRGIELMAEELINRTKPDFIGDTLWRKIVERDDRRRPVIEWIARMHSFSEGQYRAMRREAANMPEEVFAAYEAVYESAKAREEGWREMALASLFNLVPAEVNDAAVSSGSLAGAES